MATIKITDKRTLKKLNKHKVRPTVKEEQINIEIELIDEETSRLLAKYFECEKIAKRIVKCAYLPEFINEQSLKYSQLLVAVAYLDYKINSSDLEVLFNGNYKNNVLLSLRKARDLLVHDISVNNISRLKKYKKTYNLSMDKFINACKKNKK